MWVKRVDLTGLGMGGNKARKLEFLCGAAVAEGAGTLVTVGAETLTFQGCGLVEPGADRPPGSQHHHECLSDREREHHHHTDPCPPG